MPTYANVCKATKFQILKGIRVIPAKILQESSNYSVLACSATKYALNTFIPASSILISFWCRCDQASPTEAIAFLRFRDITVSAYYEDS